MWGMTQVGLLNTPQSRAIQAIGRFRFLKRRQVTRLFYTPESESSNNYGSKAVTDLKQAGYVETIQLSKNHEDIAYLSRRGYKALTAEEIDIGEPHHHKPPESYVALTHTIEANDGVIAFLNLDRDPAVRVAAFWSENEIKRWHLAAAPDGWVDLTINGVRDSVWIEVDRHTETITRWKDKCRRIKSFYADKSYEACFGTSRIVIAVFAPDDVRRNHLAQWTAEELGSSRWKDYFLFTGEPATTPAVELFFGDHWLTATGEIRPLFRGGGG